MGVTIEPVTAWDGFAVEWHHGDRVVLSRRRYLYEADGVGGTPRRLGEIPVPLVQRAVSHVRLGQRLLRAMVYNVLPLGEGQWFVTYGRRMGVLSRDGFREIVLPRPARVLRGGVAASPDGSLWFGEYFDNADRGEMHIFRWGLGDTDPSVAHTFARGEIYHVHSLTWDPYRSALICCTGDRGSECRILMSDDGFRTVEVIGAGTEDWRAVSVVPQEDGWLLGTDAEFRQNVVAHVAARDGTRTRVTDVGGPVYYSKQSGAGALFAVTAERCHIMPDPIAELWFISHGQAKCLGAFPKDLSTSRWAWRLFLPGTLHFASGPGSPSHTFISGVALSGLDGKVLILRHP